MQTPKKHTAEDIIIVAKGKCLNGDIVVTYFYKDQPDLKRIKIEGDN